jgi:hypothetical protein
MVVIVGLLRQAAVDYAPPAAAVTRIIGSHRDKPHVK